MFVVLLLVLIVQPQAVLLKMLCMHIVLVLLVGLFQLILLAVL